MEGTYLGSKKTPTVRVRNKCSYFWTFRKFLER